MLPEHKRESIGRSLWRTATSWNPQHRSPPTVDPDFTGCGALERVGEVCRYQLLRLEYALAPGGTVREWLKLWLRLLILLSTPACLLLPPLLIITAGAADLAVEMQRLCLGLLNAMLAIAGIALIGSVLVAWFGRRNK